MITIARLKRRAEFLAVSSSRRRHATPGLILQAMRHDGSAAPRVGFTASRKVGIAVERNRARRRLKAAASQVLAPHAASATDYVVIARSATLTRKFGDLLADLETAMRRLDAYEEGKR